MNLRRFIQLARKIETDSDFPKTILILPTTTLHDEKVLTKINLVGNYKISFQKLNHTPIWFSNSNVEPDILANYLDRLLEHQNSLVLKNPYNK